MADKDSTITISVIIATYNRAHYLPQCLESLFEQTRPPDEIIVVDDGSTDHTQVVAESYGSRIRYVYQENTGRPGALNRGMGNAKGSHFCFFDDDDILLPEGLATHVAVLARDSNADYTYSPNLIYDDPDGRPSRWDETQLRPVKQCQTTIPEELFVRTLEWGESFLIYLQGMLIPARCIRDVGPFDEDLLRGQDYKLMLQLARRYRGVGTGTPTFIMRNHDGQRGPAQERHAESERMAMWAKYDRKIILPYRETLPLSAYLPNNPGDAATRDLGSVETRAALLQRSRIMFSHGLFQEGLQDIELIGREGQLSEPQLEAIGNMIRQTANLEKPHYLQHASQFASRIARHGFIWPQKKVILTEALKGCYWAVRRFQRRREVAHAAIVLRALAVLTLRRARVVA